jgi:ALMS motif
VGYNLKLVGTNLSEAEKEALKKYFDQQGLSFNEEKIVVFQTPLKPAPPERAHEDKSTSMSKKKLETGDKWQRIFKKYKEKYQYLDDSCVDIRSFSSPDAKSTPKQKEEVGVELGRPIATQTSYIEIVCKEVQTSPPPEEEKADVNVATQTSGVEIVSKEVQASPPPQEDKEPAKLPDVNVSTQTSLVKITTQATSPQNPVETPSKASQTGPEEGMSTAASFEFFTKSKSARRDDSDSPLAMTLPSKTASRQSSGSRNSSSSQQAVAVQSFDEDLDLAMSVLNRIFASKSMNSELKKTLVAEILQKISRKHEAPVISKSSSPPASLDSFLQPQTHSEINFESLKITGEVSKPPITTLDRAPPPHPKSKDRQRVETGWIDQEIDHLYNLKKLMTLPPATKPAGEPRYLSSLPARTTGNVYENIEKLKHKIGELKKRSSDSAQGRATAERLVRRMTEGARVSVSSGTYDSHANLNKIIQSRSKLKTPASSSASASEESILKFIKQRKARADEENMYTRPYSGNEEVAAAYSLSPYSSTKTNPDPRSTSISSLSHSISIPVSNSATNSTTTHYNHDLRTVVASHRMATQTTDSLTKTRPIFESRAGAKTVRIAPAPNNKRLQARPPAIAYCLTFQRDDDDGLSSIEKADSTKSDRLTKARKDEQNSGKATGDFSIDLLTLQQQLAASRPRVYRQLERRSHLVTDLKQMRSERNLVRHELAQLSPETALERIKHLPPAPLATKRLFTTRTMKQATSRKCLVLPEVLRKQEIERLNREKRLNRLVTERFNRNLKQLTLKGKINLSNSVMIQ